MQKELCAAVVSCDSCPLSFLRHLEVLGRGHCRWLGRKEAARTSGVEHKDQPELLHTLK